MDPRDAKIFRNAFSEIFRVKSLLSSRKPNPSRDELLIKLQEHYGTVIFFDPLLSLERKFEVELWNTVFKDPINSCIEFLRKTSHTSNSYEHQQRYTALIDRASGFYSSLMHKLLERLPDAAWTKGILETSCTFYSPTIAKSCWGGGRYDLDVLTLQTQLTRFTRKEKASLLDTAKFVATFEGSQQRPIILPRGERIPDSGEHPLEPSTFKGEALSPLKITLSEAVLYLIQHCCIHLGDLARYQHQNKIAISYYVSAWLIDPTCGHAYNQLGVIESTKTKPQMENLCYFYIRAISCSFPFLLSRRNLKRIMDTTVFSTTGLSEVLQNSEMLNDFCEFLLFPLPVLLNLHSLLSNNSDTLVIVKAANEFSLAANVLASIVSANQGSVDLPRSLNESVAARIIDFSKLKSITISLESLQQLQVRLLKLIVVHSFGLKTNWSNETNPLFRQCILHTTVSLLNWLCAVAASIGNKCQMTENLPVMPILLVALALRAQCLPTDPENKNILDSEILEFAPPLSKSAIDFLNSLVDVSTSNYTAVEDLSEVDLPELFALQGFLPMGIPPYKNSRQSGPYVDLLPHSFFDDDFAVQTTYFRTRVSLLISTLRSVAGELPGLLKWSDIGKAFVVVDRAIPRLPQPPQLELVDVLPEMKEIEIFEREILTNQSEDTQGGKINKNAEDFSKGVNHLHLDDQGVVASRPPRTTESSLTLNQSPLSAPLLSTKETQKLNYINTSELARFIQEQASQVVARQRRRQEEEEAGKIDTTAIHSYSGSRSKFQKDLPPRFSRLHEVETARLNPNGNDSFESGTPKEKRRDEYISTLLPRPLDQSGSQNSQPFTNTSGVPLVFEPRCSPHTLGIVHAHPQQWHLTPPPFTCPGNWSRPFLQPPPQLPQPYMSVPLQRPMIFNGDIQEGPYYLVQNTTAANHQSNFPRSAFT